MIFCEYCVVKKNIVFQLNYICDVAEDPMDITKKFGYGPDFVWPFDNLRWF